MRNTFTLFVHRHELELLIEVLERAQPRGSEPREREAGVLLQRLKTVVKVTDDAE